MLHYIIQTIAFQLLFLLVYDLLLKKETFFNWNRAYLIITPLLSLALPFIQLDSFKEVVPQAYAMQLPVIVLAETTVTESQAAQASLLPDLFWWQWVLLAGSLLSVLWFGYKLYKIYQLKRQGKIHWYQEYTEVLLTKSEVAFSFFKHIFLGDSIKEMNHQHIIEHELVHIKEKHTWDLILFEVLRIVFWFNPLIYIYQARISELHEFIADAHTAKKSKKQSYELLLEQVFNTEHISFINQFFNHSLIKKRIVMLQKTKSRKVWQLKYLLMIPLVAGMLVYTSCEKDRREELVTENNIVKKVDIPFAVVTQKPMFTECKDVVQEEQFSCFKEQLDAHVRKNFRYPQEAQEQGIQGRVYVQFRINVDGSVSMLNKRGPDVILENEAVRIIKTLPELIPGKDRAGDAVPVTFAYPIVFKLNGDNTKKEPIVEIQRVSESKLNNTNSSIDVPFTVVHQAPSFVGCENAESAFDCFKEKLDAHVRKYFNYPQEAQEQGIQGRVYVQFRINEDGSVSMMNKRGPHKLIEDEAIRIIEALPQLNPGRDENGNAVSVTFAYPIVFKLN